MKIAIFGGTGRTGKHVVEQALAKGFEVKVLARTPSKLVIENDALTVIEGDISDEKTVEETINGVDAVISVLGPTSNEPVFEVSCGMEHILAAMKKDGVRRLIISAGAGVGDPKDEPKFINHLINFLLKLMAKNVLDDMSRTVKLVRESDLDWTVVRMPMLTDDPKTGHVKVGYVGKGTGPRISRADAAEFLLAQLDNETYLRKSPVISN